jgi:hypothetical protein
MFFFFQKKKQKALFCFAEDYSPKLENYWGSCILLFPGKKEQEALFSFTGSIAPGVLGYR